MIKVTPSKCFVTALKPNTCYFSDELPCGVKDVN